LQGTYEILPGLNLKGSLAYSPRSQVTNNDIHQLRSDLRYDPSISIQSTGSGYNYELELNYNFWKNWSAFVGYRSWQLSANDDDNAVEFFDQSGVSGFGTKLNNIQIKRDGVTAGFGYNFKGRSL
jgi:predicted porin